MNTITFLVCGVELCFGSVTFVVREHLFYTTVLWKQKSLRDNKQTPSCCYTTVPSNARKAEQGQLIILHNEEGNEKLRNAR